MRTQGALKALGSQGDLTVFIHFHSLIHSFTLQTYFLEGTVHTKTWPFLSKGPQTHRERDTHGTFRYRMLPALCYSVTPYTSCLALQIDFLHTSVYGFQGLLLGILEYIGIPFFLLYSND